MPSAARETVRRLLARAVRPAVWPIEQRLDEIIEFAERRDALAVWRGGLDGHTEGGDGLAHPDDTGRLRKELAYWAAVVRGADPGFPGDFRDTFGRWQRTRLYELAVRLGLAGDFAPGEPITGRMAEWCAQRTAVEIGSGPYPAVAAARWRRAIAVDPLADGYFAEGLIPPEADRVAFLASPGEAVPLPDAVADLVIAENCLDHVVSPPRVATEMARLLVPGGVAWVLVDVLDEPDDLHPHAMDETVARNLLEAAGLRLEWAEVWDGHSHPNARGQWRALLRKPQ